MRALLVLVMAQSAVACGGGSATGGERAGATEAGGCAGHDVDCETLTRRFVGNAAEAPLIVMDLEIACEEREPSACEALGFFLLDGADVPREPVRAVTLLLAACGRGRHGACLRAARHLEANDEEASRAVRAYEVVCDAGGAEGCAGLANLLARGRGVERDRDRALTLNRGACEAGIAEACRRVADHHVGTGDRASLIAHYEGQCEEGGRGCTLLADLFDRGSDAAERARIGGLLERACGGNDADGCTRFARALASGAHGVSPDARRAKSILERVCRVEHWAACAELGQLHERGVVGPPNESRALEHYEAACNRRSGLACYRLGRSRRESGAHDEATRFFRTACDSGEEERACGALAAAYDTGRGARQDRAAAIPLYHRACDAGHPDSCVRVSTLLEVGEGGEPDPTRARAFSERACELHPFDDICPTRRTRRPLPRLEGTVTEVSGFDAVVRGLICRARVSRVLQAGWCRVHVTCDPLPEEESEEDEAPDPDAEPEPEPEHYGESGGWARCEVSRRAITASDSLTTPWDDTPTLTLDTRAGTLRLEDVDPARTRILEVRRTQRGRN